MCFKPGPSRAVSQNLDINGGKMWWGRWVSSVIWVIRRCCSTGRLLLSQISVHGSGKGCTVQPRKCCALHPPPCLTPVRVRKGVHLWGPCCTPGCGPTAAPVSVPGPAWEPWREHSCSRHHLCCSSPGQLPIHALLPGPNALSASKFICNKLEMFYYSSGTQYI